MSKGGDISVGLVGSIFRGSLEGKGRGGEGRGGEGRGGEGRGGEGRGGEGRGGEEGREEGEEKRMGRV